MKRPVLVGWSGSQVSQRAVEVAAGFAVRHQVPLRIVVAWDFLDQPGPGFDPEISPEKVQAAVDVVVDGVRLTHPGLEVHGDALLGWPPAVVCDAAQDADLLVVGRSEKTQGHFGEWSPDVLIRRVLVPVVYVP